MQYERNIIIHSVFPRLRKEFSSKLIDITEVDLRWGIPEESSENSKILEICIGEVLHCFPYFVGIVGDRYGYIATDEAIKDLPPAYKQALGDHVPRGLSITELEMRAGVFVPNNVEFSCFFIKKQIIIDKELQPKVKKLLTSIKEGYETHVYNNASDFEEMLFTSLRNYILKTIPDNLEIPYNDKSYYSHLRILKNNNYRYIADSYFIIGFERKINLYKHVYLQGEKGLGKSACMSYLAREEGIERDGNVFFHYANADSQSTHADNVFFRLRLYLQSTFGYTSKEEDNHNAVIDIINSGHINQRIVLFFDALDQINDITIIYKLFALSNLNENVYVICSGTENYTRIMGEQVIVINYLNSDQISQIVSGTLAQYGKRLGRRMKQDIMLNKNCSNSLFLKAMIAQLIMYGTYSTFDAFFYKLLQAQDFGELFSIVISRIKDYYIERSIDPEKVDLALGLIIYSHNGVKESELQDILGVVPVARSVFLNAIDLFIIDDNELIKFNHNLIIKSAKVILNKSKINYSNIVADAFITYFKSHGEDWRKYSELPYQLCKIGKINELQKLLSLPDCFLYLSEYELHSLRGYLSHLVHNQLQITYKIIPSLNIEERIRTAEIMCLSGCYKAAILITQNMIKIENNPTNCIRLLSVLARAQYKLATNNYKTSISTYIKLIHYFKKIYPSDEIGYASYAYLLGVAYKSAGQLETSLMIIEECANIFNRNNVCSATSAWVLDVYGQTCYISGKVKKALKILDKVISDCTYLFGNNSSELAWSYCYGWNILYSIEDKSNAIQMIQNAYKIYDKLYLGKIISR